MYDVGLWSIVLIVYECVHQVHHVVDVGIDSDRVPYASLVHALKFWNVAPTTSNLIKHRCHFETIAERLRQFEADLRDQPLTVQHTEATGSEYRRLFWHMYNTRYLRLPDALRAHGKLITSHVTDFVTQSFSQSSTHFA